MARHGPFQEQRRLPAVRSLLSGQSRYAAVRHQPYVPGGPVHDRHYVQRRAAIVSNRVLTVRVAKNSPERADPV